MLAHQCEFLGTKAQVRCPRNVPAFRPSPTRLAIITLAAFALLTLVAGENAAFAQGKASGFELAFHGSREVVAGKIARFRGVAYRVHGLAELRKIPAARVRGRVVLDENGAQPWQEFTANSSGFFQVGIPIPEFAKGAPLLEVEVGTGNEKRIFEFPLTLIPEFLVDVHTDRKLYETGEKIHAWIRVRDSQSLRPVSNIPVAIAVAKGAESKHRSGEAGVVSLVHEIPKGTDEGNYAVVASIGGTTYRAAYRVGTRSYDRIFAKISVSPKSVAPNQMVDVSIAVTGLSGASVRNAQIKLRFAGRERLLQTDDTGVAVVKIASPSFLDGQQSRAIVTAVIEHPAFGQTKAFSSFELVVPQTMTVDAVPDNGALVPELASNIYFSLSEGGETVPPVGTEIVVTGACIPGGSARGKTDKHGIVVISAKLPRGAASGEEGETLTSVIVQVQGPAPTTVPMKIAVARESEVIPRVDTVVVAPGEEISIELFRRASAKRTPIVVEMLSDGKIVRSRLLRAGVRRLRMRSPSDMLGVFLVRARPLHQKSVVEGTGSVDAFLVRPAQPSFASLESSKKTYKVKGMAQLSLRTNPKSKKSWVAVVARDLTAHAGERSFQRWFLSGAFDQAVLDPASKTATTLLRMALSGYVQTEEVPEKALPLLDELGDPGEESYDLDSSIVRGVMRDPFPLSEELSRRGVGQVMNRIEEILSEAVADGTLSDLVIRTREKSRFRPAVFDEFDEIPRTLGEGELTLAMLHRADPAFTFDNVGRRVARRQLVGLLVALAYYLDPGDDASPEMRGAAKEPKDRWLSRMVQRGLVEPESLRDPWGKLFELRASKSPAVSIAVHAASLELVSAGPDGRFGTKDDIDDPFERTVPAGTTYAVASGEDLLMENLGLLSPGPDVLQRLLAAYQRVSAEVFEEERGDAVGASMSMGFGGIGSGGGGRGYGSGSGHGKMGARRSSSPSVRIGRAGSSGVRGFGNVLRQKFPATLFFASAIPVDPSGTTQIDIKLSDAVTSYKVEAIVWSEDGWTWSANTTFEVAKETVIDTPLPSFATVGDRLQLPIRVTSRAANARMLAVSVYASDKPNHLLVNNKELKSPANDTVIYPLELLLPKAMDGAITVGVRSKNGLALDAVQRPIVVRESARRVRKRVELLSSGSDTLLLNIHKMAIPRKGSEILVRMGASVFELKAQNYLSDWASAWTETPSTLHSKALLSSAEGSKLAAALASSWTSTKVSDKLVSKALKKLTVEIHTQTSSLARDQSLTALSRILLSLSPVSQDMNARKKLAPDIRAVLRSLRKVVRSGSAAQFGNIHTTALSAASLALTEPKNGDWGHVRELLRRLRREEVQVGGFRWIATEEGGHATSALVALAELQLGKRKRALALLRTLSKLHLGSRGLDPWTSTLARVVALRASAGTKDSTLVMRVDGKSQRLAWSEGLLRIPADALSQPGVHRIEIDPGTNVPTLYYLQASGEYGLPWDIKPGRKGSITVAIEGKVRGHNQNSELVLVIRNRSPRTIASPIIEVSLPAGAELDRETKKLLRGYLKEELGQSGGTMHLALRGLAPGASVRVPLPLRWSVGGRLQGLGIASYPAGKPDDLSVLQPRILTIKSAKGTP